MRSKRERKGWEHTEGLLVIEFALFLWLFLIVVLATSHSNHRHKPVIIKPGTSGKGAPNSFMYRLAINTQSFQARNYIPTLPQVAQEHVHQKWPMLTGGATGEPIPEPQIGKPAIYGKIQ